MKNEKIPEIDRTDLSLSVLKIKKCGYDDIKKFDFFKNPGKIRLDRCEQMLKLLGAINDDDKVTSLGYIMLDLPWNPELVKIAITAYSLGCEKYIL